MGLTPLIILHVYYFEIAMVFLFILGAGLGAMDAGMAVWIVEMWPYHNSIILPISSALFGVGQVVGPVLMSPFVYGEEEASREERIRSLTAPFMITSVIQLFMPILYIILNFTSMKYEKPIRNEEKDSVATMDPRLDQNPYRFIHLCLAGVAVGAYGAAELGWNLFSPTMFQHMGDKMFTAAQASLLVAFWSAAFAVGLLITTVLALRYTPDRIILVQYFTVFGSLLLMYLGHNVKAFVYISTVIFGAGMSSLWAMKFAFIGKCLLSQNY